MLTEACLSLDAISKTTFAYDIAQSDQSIPTLLTKITEVPQSTTAFVMGALVDAFPVLLKLPSPLKHFADMLRSELVKIADKVLSQTEHGDMHTKLLDSLSTCLAPCSRPT